MTGADVLDQAEIDRLAWESWQTHRENAAEAARQLGVSPSTVRARVKRHQARQPAAPARRKAGPPPRCPGVGQEGLDGPGTSRCPVCTQDLAPVRRDGTLGSHKLLRPRT